MFWEDFLWYSTILERYPDVQKIKYEKKKYISNRGIISHRRSTDGELLFHFIKIQIMVFSKHFKELLKLTERQPWARAVRQFK